MSTWVGVGESRISDALKAGEEAAAKALAAMGQPYPDLVFVFGSTRYDQETLLKGVTSVTHETPLVGCSTAGEILSEGPSRRSVAVAAIRSDTLKVSVGLGLRVSDNPRQAGQEVATQTTKAKLLNPHGFLMFPDGISGNAAEVIRGVQDIFGLSFPIVGGSAADDFGFSRTYQYFGRRVYSNCVVGVLLTGPIALGIGARHGWQPLGKPRLVTQSLANVVKQLDRQPAANLYESYFGKQAHSLKSEELADMSILYPMGMPIPGEEEYLLRNILRVDPDGSLVYAGEVPEGSEVRLMMGSKQKAIEAARRAAEMAMSAIAPRTPSFGLVFSSCSRSRLFGRQAGDEIRAIREILGSTIPMIGFYGYGEQAPLTAAGFRGRSHFHNETLVVVVISAP